jgi:RHS repeat-associated protein
MLLGKIVFTKRVAYIVFGALAIGTATIAAGNQNGRLVPPLQSRPGGTHARITQGVIAPTQQLINATLATKTLVGPGVLYIETYPTDQQNVFLSQGHGGTRLNHSSELLAPSSRLHTRPHFGQPNSVISGSPNVTGINHWWTYEEDAIPGLGKYMANVATGNLIVQSDDMATPHKGVELAFRRTYNSFSQHDYANTDGSTPDNYGDGWTNTFDAHIAFNDLNSGNGVSVFDIDGARYDYTATCGSSCVYTPPAGQFAQLKQNQSGDFSWTKKTGTIYWFHNPNATNIGVDGRLEEIIGRNNNTFLKFAYYFDANHVNDSAHLNEIRVIPEWAGPPATATSYVDLKFADFSNGQGGTNRLLNTLTWMDMTTQVTYNYTTTPSLTEIIEPSDSASRSATIPQWFTFYPSPFSHLIHTASGGRYSVSNGSDGSYEAFSYSGNAIASVQSFGWINPTINDGVNSTGPIQSAFAANYGINSPYRTVTIVNSTASPMPTPLPAPAPAPTGIAACSASQSTTWYDSDGHESLYCFDSANRVVQSDDWTNSLWLTTVKTWDATNDLLSTTDARGNESDMAYDGNGNAVMVARPARSSGTFRPTATYAYDANNNVVAYCDPAWNDINGHDYKGTTIPACPTTWPNSPASPGPTLMTVKVQSYEPFGELATTTTPMGYLETYFFAASQQGGSLDFGLPTSVIGTTITQFDQSKVTPTRDFVYDQVGNLICYSKNGGTGWWILQYDSGSLGRVLAIADPDDDPAASGISQPTCAKTAGISGATITTTKTYFADGSVATSQSPDNRAAGVAESFTYDPDGDVLTDLQHFGTASVPGGALAYTQKWYDARDRLVELREPDAQSPPIFSSPAPTLDKWTTRYLYDLTQGGSVSFNGGTGFFAHGNLFKTLKNQVDSAATAFDALDRPVAKYGLQPGNSLFNSPTTLVYDSLPALLGLLGAQTDPLGETKSFTYDNDGSTLTENFAGDGNVTPDETYGYDADNRVVSIASSTFGTDTRSFDADGRLASRVEPGSGVAFAPASYTYDYYANGDRANLTFSIPSTGVVQNDALQYAYNSDGSPTNELINVAGVTNASLTWTYTRADREEVQADSLGYSDSNTIDLFGRIGKLTIPAGSYVNLGYDPEGNVVSHSYSAPTGLCNGNPGCPQSIALSYDARDEMNQRTFDPIGTSQEPQPLGPDAGYMIPYSCSGTPNPTCISDATVVDRTAGVLIKTHDYGAVADGGKFPHWSNGEKTTDNKWTYDIAGRETTHLVTVALSWTELPGDNPCSGGGNETTTRNYDAENHILSQTAAIVDPIPQAPCFPGPIYFAQQYAPVSLGWGPNGHPITYNSNAIAYTLHWDGDALLFITNAAGTLVDFKVGMSGDIVPSDTNYALTIFDRDFGGAVASEHNSTGFNVWEPLNPSYGGSGVLDPAEVNGSTGYNVGACLLCPWRTDGYEAIAGVGQFGVDPLTIQGARAYDGSAGTWTSPDAFAGDVDDPMSQQSYMWNGNNPVNYQDPSGYDQISVVYRLVFKHGVRAYHSYIQIAHRLANGSIMYTNYSAGPTGGKIAMQSADSEKGHPVLGTFTVAASPGIVKGELAIANFSSFVESDKQPYLGIVSNSNTFTSEALHAGGYNYKSAPNSPGWTPGWLDLTSQPMPQPPPPP